MGGGESGVGSAILAKKQGFNVLLSDSGTLKNEYRQALQDNGIKFEEGGHTEEIVLQASEIIKSPGIPNTAKIVAAAVAKGISVVSEIEFAARYTNAQMICITGSNGKTTTTSLIYKIMKDAGMNVGLGGNIGKSFAWQVASENFDYYVLELSSFQLDNMYDFRANVAILLNITPDHLDRYDHKLENYARSKFRIAQNMTQDDAFIYCAEDPVTMQYLREFDIKAQKIPFALNPSSIINQKTDYACIHHQILTSMYNNETFTVLVEELSLKGKHNQYNSMAATLAGQVHHIKKDSIRESLRTFANIEHRLEHVLKVRGVLFINDSKATNINSAWYALESMEAPTVWIAGGTDKGNDYRELADLVRQKVKAIVCLGVDNAKIIAAFSKIVPTIVETCSAKDAVQAAYHLAAKGDTVLLSPACASFDLFKNYEDRGQQFKEAVKNL
ncbi:UDP-N-acetylmuramoylalanine--D-glutamate ligase [Bacteroidia bacterium]|nr:UDP-N-acetylmuramoylalanine--D-glutamate ligase [Bacteroidia bacterium]